MTSGQPPREQSGPAEEPTLDAAAESHHKPERPTASSQPASPGARQARSHADDSAAAASAAASAAMAAVSAAIAATAASDAVAGVKSIVKPAPKLAHAAMAERPPKAVHRTKPAPAKVAPAPMTAAAAAAAAAFATTAPAPPKSLPVVPGIIRREQLPPPAPEAPAPVVAVKPPAPKPVPAIPGIIRREDLASGAVQVPSSPGPVAVPPTVPQPPVKSVPAIPGITRREEVAAAKAAAAERLAAEEDAAGLPVLPIVAAQPAAPAASVTELPPPKFVPREGAPKGGEDLADKVSRSPVFYGMAMVLLGVRVAFARLAAAVTWPYRQLTAKPASVSDQDLAPNPYRKRKKRGLIATFANGAFFGFMGLIVAWVLIAGVILPVVSPTPAPIFVGDETENPYATDTPGASQIAAVSPSADVSAGPSDSGEPGASPTATPTGGPTLPPGATPTPRPTVGPTLPPGATPSPTPAPTPTPAATPTPPPGAPSPPDKTRSRDALGPDWG